MTLTLSAKAIYSWVIAAGVTVAGSAGTCLLIAH